MPHTDETIRRIAREEITKATGKRYNPGEGWIGTLYPSDPAPRLSTASDFRCEGCRNEGTNWFRTVMGDVICTHCGWSKRLQRALDEIQLRGGTRIAEATIGQLINEAHRRLK